MATPTDLKIDGLNFAEIRENFKSFLQAQSQFTDYNFNGSGLSTLIDVLAYNTYYNSFYLNMVSTESFLSTAQRRSSVVNLARSLNYTPRSTSSARVVCTLNVTPTGGTPSTITLPKYTRFEAIIEDVSYYFLTQDALIFIRDGNGQYILENVTLVEGKLVTEKYIKNTLDSDQRFLINNEMIDTSTLSVRVINSSADSTTRVFSKATNIVNVEFDSLVYFIEEVEDGKFEIFFGDDILGVALVNGNLIYMEYLISSGNLANDVNALTLASSVSGVTSIEVTVTQPSFGGDDRESIDRIKFNAPKSYASQNRAVTPDDYLSFVLNQPNVDSAIVWGGEDNDPPVYGKVFIAVKPKVGNSLTTVEKQNIVNYVLKPKKVLTFETEIVDPDYIYLLIDSNIKYDSTQNVLSTTNLETIIRNTVSNYNSKEIGGFSKYFRYSKLSRLIDTSERSILSSVLTVRMRKEVSISLNVSSYYKIDFVNPIDDITSGRVSTHPFNAGNKISSNEFTYNGLAGCFLEENGGIMRIYRKVGPSYIGVEPNIGTVDYQNGTVVLNGFKPQAFADGGTTLKLTAIPAEMDILPLRTQIITIRDEDVTVNLIDDNTISNVKR